MPTSRYHHGNLRKRLLDLAGTEIEKSGLDNLSLRKLAKAAGVSHAAPAHHFGSVRGLLTALATEGFKTLAKALRAGNNVRDVYVDFGLSRPVLFSLMFDSSLPDFDDLDLDRESERAFALFLEQIGAGPVRPDIAAMAEWSRLHGLITLLNSGRMRSVLSLPDDDKAAAIKAIALAGSTQS